MKTLKLASIAAVAIAGALLAQNPGAQRNIVHRGDVRGGNEAVIAAVQFAPGGSVGRHTHPGEEISYVIEGEGDLMITGQPVRHIKAGDGFIVPAGVIHDAKSSTDHPMKLSAVYYVEKGKPMATPVQ